MFSEELHALVKELGEICKARKLTFAAAESCTGGMVSDVITSHPGVSEWFYGSFVTYSNEAKKAMLNVSSIPLMKHGAVSDVIAEAMVTGVFENTHADLAVSITGIAGPDGGTAEKPVGTVWFAVGRRDHSIIKSTQCFKGDRTAIRLQSAQYALSQMIGLLND